MPATTSPRGLTEGMLEPYFYEVVSSDGTRLEAWTNDPDCLIDGPTVLLCNGLGTGPWAWPSLLDADCGVRVISWHHRGIGCSERPVDPARVGIADFVEDAVAVLDASGAKAVVVMGWSIGVNTMFELALHHPARVSGVFAVAGVPGGTFASMLEPSRLPAAVREAIMVNLVRLGRVSGALLSPIAVRLPVGRRAVAVLSRTGFMRQMADPDLTARAILAFLQTPLEWYFHLALRTHQHLRVPLDRIAVPCVLIAANGDMLAGPRDMYAAAERLADATYVEFRGSHFIQMEQPDAVHGELLAFLERVT